MPNLNEYYFIKNLLDEARTNNTYVIGFVVQGWEDACSFVEAAQETDSGIILQSGPGFRKNMPLEVIYSMFEKLGKEANVKVVPHLDHGENYDICKKALDIGFTSIMYDGSKLPFEKNLEQSFKIYEFVRFAELFFVNEENERNNSSPSGNLENP